MITHTLVLANGVADAFSHCNYLVDLYVRKVPNPSFYQPTKPKGPRQFSVIQDVPIISRYIMQAYHVYVSLIEGQHYFFARDSTAVLSGVFLYILSYIIEY